MSEININELVAIYLRYGTASVPLRDLAFAQMAQKVLFLRGGASSVSEVASGIADVLNCSAVSFQSVEQGLFFLENKGQVSKNMEGWTLNSVGEQMIRKDLDRTSYRIRSILERHFPHSVDPRPLEAWFSDANVLFFSTYGDRWVAAICRGIPLKTSLAEDLKILLSPITVRHRLNVDEDSMVAGFRAFLTSSHPEDQEHLWSLGQAMFSSRLVAANVSADPITIKEIRGSTILLDTNVLIASCLKEHRLCAAISSLAMVLNQIEAELSAVQITHDEYKSVVNYHCNSIVRVARSFRRNILQKSSNAFLKTAIELGCDDPEDFEKFFYSIVQPPTSLNENQRIVVLDSSDIVSEIDNGTRDENLKKEISTVWSLRRSRPKGIKSKEHDAGLLYAAKHLRAQGKKCWILTLDRTLHEYSITHTGSLEYPLVLSLDVLIQILAVESAGPDSDASAFAPILSGIIDLQFEPLIGTYTPEDLEWLLDIEERCGDLSDSSVTELAIIVNRARLSGARHDDQELRLSIQRAFQAKKKNMVGSIESAQEMIRIQEKDLDSKDHQLSAVITALKEARRKELIQKAKQTLRNGIVMWSLGALALIMLGYCVSLLITPPDSPAQFVGILVSFIGPAISAIFAIFQNVIPKYNSDREQVERTVNEETTKMINEGRN